MNTQESSKAPEARGAPSARSPLATHQFAKLLKQLSDCTSASVRGGGSAQQQAALDGAAANAIQRVAAFVEEREDLAGLATLEAHQLWQAATTVLEDVAAREDPPRESALTTAALDMVCLLSREFPQHLSAGANSANLAARAAAAAARLAVLHKAAYEAGNYDVCSRAMATLLELAPQAPVIATEACKALHQLGNCPDHETSAAAAEVGFDLFAVLEPEKMAERPAQPRPQEVLEKLQRLNLSKGAPAASTAADDVRELKDGLKQATDATAFGEAVEKTDNAMAPALAAATDALLVLDDIKSTRPDVYAALVAEGVMERVNAAAGTLEALHEPIFDLEKFSKEHSVHAMSRMQVAAYLATNVCPLITEVVKMLETPDPRTINIESVNLQLAVLVSHSAAAFEVLAEHHDTWTYEHLAAIGMSLVTFLRITDGLTPERLQDALLDTEGFTTLSQVILRARVDGSPVEKSVLDALSRACGRALRKLANDRLLTIQAGKRTTAQRAAARFFEEAEACGGDKDLELIRLLSETGTPVELRCVSSTVLIDARTSERMVRMSAVGKTLDNPLPGNWTKWDQHVASAWSLLVNEKQLGALVKAMAKMTKAVKKGSGWDQVQRTWLMQKANDLVALAEHQDDLFALFLLAPPSLMALMKQMRAEARRLQDALDQLHREDRDALSGGDHDAELVKRVAAHREAEKEAAAEIKRQRQQQQQQEMEEQERAVEAAASSSIGKAAAAAAAAAEAAVDADLATAHDPGADFEAGLEAFKNVLRKGVGPDAVPKAREYVERLRKGTRKLSPDAQEFRPRKAARCSQFNTYTTDIRP